MPVWDILRDNFTSPIVLAFALGVFAKLVRSELSLPKDLYTSLSIYLLLALGLKGGVELAHAEFRDILAPAGVTLLLGCLTPVTAYWVLRRLGRFSISDSAGIAAHYGSVSAVTFIAAQQFLSGRGVAVEGYMPTLLTLLESPGIHIALAIGAIGTAPLAATGSTIAVGGAGAAVLAGDGRPPMASEGDSGRILGVLHEVLTGRTMILLVGGLVVGFLMGDKGYKPIAPFFDIGFKGALTLFLLEMGLVAGSRLSDLRQAGLFLLGFGILMPLAHGALGVALGAWAGLSPGGCTVLAAMAASASYIAAPPAVRATLPDANPTYSLTSALVITFPFNLVAGIPLYYELASRVAAG